MDDNCKFIYIYKYIKKFLFLIYMQIISIILLI